MLSFQGSELVVNHKSMTNLWIAQTYFQWRKYFKLYEYESALLIRNISQAELQS